MPTTKDLISVLDELATAEATDAVIGEVETVDVGPFNGHYFRISAADLVIAVDDARRVLTEIEAAVLDARQDKADAERHDCWCGVRLEADETTCGAKACDRNHADDMAGLIP